MTSYYTFIVLIFFVCYNLDGDCMNNRGFTLIEITCVILLLGILVTFIVPKTTSIIKENKRKTCNSIVTSLEDAANTYTYKNTTLVDNGISSNGYYDISINKLGQKRFELEQKVDSWYPLVKFGVLWNFHNYIGATTDLTCSWAVKEENYLGLNCGLVLGLQFKI